ncbi:Endoplasmic reticulum mannosyl-oligosaccharide 1,2-alpha-mannosidase [Madurella mycetomatis]|uniref:alpha-1,2-Mannosidase n=1 Tax=Madurella mycetomatis TaxID=100816 RepID=A0A175W0R6_9PEZI|nr:Endoplasmic reticulum mannosyl-oligosaccharide 1,2-alpha-mannosidase [Madurella mycetomatis]
MSFARRRGPLALIPGAAILVFLVYLYLWQSGSHVVVTTPRPADATTFPAERRDARARSSERQQAVKRVFAKCWRSYKEHAWGSDELAPVSAGRRNHFGGWAATLVDSLDTLWIMDMKAEFNEAVAATEAINFTHTDLGEVNVFETNIRYLGGFLSAFDLSGDARLLRKAVEVGDMLYKAFDTPNRMPITRWNFHAAARGEKQVAPSGLAVAEIGTLSMEFTRLSMLTGDAKWFDAVQRVTDEMAAQQDSTALPGLWPLMVNGEKKIFNSGSLYSLGAMADSAYEYLPKMAAMMGGQLPIYQAMYEKAMDTAIKHNLFRPLTPTNEDILIAGQVHANDDGIELKPEGQHLVCFLGGLMALGGRLFERQKDMDAAKRLVDGCVWTYKALPHGIMPEVFLMAPCQPNESCQWSEEAWEQAVLRTAKAGKKGAEADVQASAIIEKGRLPKGFTAIPDRGFKLRPEAIESVFVLYRVTGREDLLESAWEMFTAIDKTTSTKLANSAVRDVTTKEKPEAVDSMESFWMGETLKYFYLIFSDPGLISLDEFVFNTEAHPFRRLLK